MPRNSRCVMPDVTFHVTQRGVNRADVFDSVEDRTTYLHLVEDHLASAGVRVLGWCLMTNHVLWVVIPQREDSLAILFRRVHGRYAQYFNARKQRTGHLWQNRFFSCPVAAEREEVVLRYVEWNPVRAEMTHRPEDYPWSSARPHLLGPGSESIPLLDWTYWREQGGIEEWRRRQVLVEDIRDAQQLRRATYSGAPFGPPVFVQTLELRYGRHWRNPGRPAKAQRTRETEADRPASVLTT